MAPKRGGGRGGKQSQTGGGRGGRGGRGSGVIDMTNGGTAAPMFGFPQPGLHNPLALGMGVGMGGNPLMPMGPQGLLGPQTAMCFAPGTGAQPGSTTDPATLAWQAMQQQMMMSQMSQLTGFGGTGGTQNTVQVKMSEADLQSLKYQKMTSYFAAMQAMQQQMQQAQQPPSGLQDASTQGSDATLEEHEDPLPNQQMLDVAKHQTKQDEIDKVVTDTIAEFVIKDEFKDNPKAALQACREAAKENVGRSTPVKQMEEIACRVVQRLTARDEKAKAAETEVKDSQESVVSDQESHGQTDLLQRLAAVESKVNTTPSSHTPTPFTQGMQMQTMMGIPWNIQSPLQALAYQQQLLSQQALAAAGGSPALPSLGASPSLENTGQPKQTAPIPTHDDHTRFDIVVSGDTSGVGWGWMTTRNDSLPMSRKAGSLHPGAGNAKYVTGLHPEADFEPTTLNTWKNALAKGPQPAPASDEAKTPTPIREIRNKLRAQHVFWMLCLMLNSVHAALGHKALESSKPPNSAEQMIQSLQDRLYAVLKEWDHPTNPGPGLHTTPLPQI